MEYIISESRFDKVIYSYLDSQFYPHEIVNTRPNQYVWNPLWVVNHEVVLEFSKKILYVKHSIKSSLITIFSLTDDEAIEKLNDYFYEKLNVPFEIEFSNMGFNQEEYDNWRARIRDIN